MRKRFFGLCLALLLCCFGFALAADESTNYSLQDINAVLSLSDSYIVLLPDQLSSHTELLANLGKNLEDVQADWEARGVRLQAWVESLDACLEVTVVQDEDSLKYYDLDTQPTASRTAWRKSHFNNAELIAQGYGVKSAEWKKQTNGGRFLRLKYKRIVGDTTYWGYVARTIRNGYTITLDYQVFGRGLKTKDEKALNKVANTVTFSSSGTAPEAADKVISFTSTPPAETTTGSFSVAGTCASNAHLIGVVMRYSSPTPTRFETDAAKTGKFKMEVQLPEEGIWLMTLTVEVDGNVVAEKVFDTTTYQKDLLSVLLAEAVPSEFSADEYTISGTTLRNTTVQCIVSGAGSFDKSVKTNASGAFKFKLTTSAEGDYNITLIFQKKGYSTRRLTYTVKRQLTVEDYKKQMRAAAIKPSYSVLKKKLEAYTGRIMGYTVYISEISEVGEEWIITAGLTQTKKGVIKNLLVIQSTEEPNFEVGSEQKMYGTCVGNYEVQSEEGTETYPCFDLLFWD